MLFGAILICAGGCIIPMTDEVSTGHRYSTESLLFLDSPGVTREDVISTLGPPLLEYTNHMTLIYAWGQTPRVYIVHPGHGTNVPSGSDGTVLHGYENYYCLFIAYGDDKRIVAHRVRNIEDRDFEEACADWSRERRKK